MTPPVSGAGTPVVLGKLSGSRFHRPHGQKGEGLSFDMIARPADISPVRTFAGERLF